MNLERVGPHAKDGKTKNLKGENRPILIKEKEATEN